MSKKQEESSGWLMAIIIGVVVAVLLVIVIYPNLVGKKNQEFNEGMLDLTNQAFVQEI